MRCYNPERTHRTIDGLTLVIIPRPSLLGVILDAKGLPSAVKYPDHSYWSKDGFKYYSTLKGINKGDHDRIKPDMVIYQLADGTLLQADLALFENSEMGRHNATQDERFCFLHQVTQLRVVEMPELEVVPVYDFSN